MRNDHCATAMTRKHEENVSDMCAWICSHERVTHVACLHRLCVRWCEACRRGSEIEGIPFNIFYGMMEDNMSSGMLFEKRKQFEKSSLKNAGVRNVADAFIYVPNLVFY